MLCQLKITKVICGYSTKNRQKIETGKAADVLSLHVILPLPVVFGRMGIPRPKNCLLFVL